MTGSGLGAPGLSLDQFGYPDYRRSDAAALPRCACWAGLAAAWWHVLGAVLGEPLPVAGIAREMGLTRQSVQRVADILVERGLAEYRDNPAHRRAKLLAPTDEGRAAIGRIGPGRGDRPDRPGHAAAAGRLAAVLGEEALADAASTLRAEFAALAEVQAGTVAEEVQAAGPVAEEVQAGMAPSE